jgi:Domain of unknown function (DUF397)
MTALFPEAELAPQGTEDEARIPTRHLVRGVAMNEFLHSEETARFTAVSAWTKSSLSHALGNCVEVADLQGGQVGMRDSKNITGPVLDFPPEEWQAFLGGVRNGEFDTFPA